MIDLYTAGTPNGQKASIMLEECGFPYTAHAVDIRGGEQNSASYRAINPNGKIPAIVDHDGGDQIVVFESGAILVYLAEKVGRLLPASGQARADALAWTFWQVGGLGPMVGQWLHFQRAAPEPILYAIDRYRREVERLLGVLDARLTDHEYLAGDYSIADIASFTWAAAGMRFLGDAAEGAFSSAKRWVEQVGARPAVIAGIAVPLKRA